MGLLDKLLAPFQGLSEAGKQRAAEAAERAKAEQEAIEARRQAYFREIMEEFADAEHIEPKPYHELSVGEAKLGKTPAIEYFERSAAVRLHHLLPMDLMRMAALVRAMGMRYDHLAEGEIGEIIDLKPKEQAPIEHGAVNLGPVPEFRNAKGTLWRFFIELSYTAAAAGGRGAIQTRRFIADCEL